ncbi:Fic family protein [Reinekea forsetii]|uniref:Filamentation induced by cAMP protein Fic n=1 Tax=Reinekea forsetii TaxID=1336806 RepID=A0A2K8KQC0_9GAMM|nr:Fic family protein [Reinekea forsetii]ATX76945.1 filamentation induced by cAMP protein Fic [Reinekea forsetii]
MTAAIIDAKEVISTLEPMLVTEGTPQRDELDEMAMELAQKSAKLSAGMNADLSRGVTVLLRNMNCYYSNLIEGHDTHPVDIDRAMLKDFDSEPAKRDLQMEAKAHIAVQERLENDLYTQGIFTQQLISAIHADFYAELPDSLSVIEKQDGTTIDIIGGEYRTGDVKIGFHIPISAGAINRFMIRYFEVYGCMNRLRAIRNAGSAHHRLAWIHPFWDGNGRTTRLHTQYALDKVLGTHGLWSVSRGFARNVDKYKGHLQACDSTRQVDTDGRGYLSTKALISFNKFFLETAIDQVDFMSGLLDVIGLSERVMIWVGSKIAAGSFPVGSDAVFRILLTEGGISKADASALIGMSERSSRRKFAEWKQLGLVVEPNVRTMRIAFPASVAHYWFPGLFPE